MLNIPNIAAQWGKIFGGVNQIDVFRGTTAPARADTISALYVTAAQQRLAAEGLYQQVQDIDAVLQPSVTYFFQLAKDTLSVAAQADTDYPIDLSEDTLLQKLINDAVAQAQTFQLPTVQIGGAGFAAGTPITTLLGSPYGTGSVIGTVVNPETGVVRYYSYAETIRAVCTTDSYSGGATPSQETFTVSTFNSVDPSVSQWPKGSGVSTSIPVTGSGSSTLFANAYFDNWSVANTPDSWTLTGLVPGVSITQSTDAYLGNYSATITGAPLNSELSQTITGLEGTRNYIAAVRIKRPATITAGVLTLSLRDQFGNILNNALASPLSVAASLTGGAGNFLLTYGIFSIPRGFPSTVRLSARFTTAMAGAETIRLDNIELIPMTSLYVGGPDIAILPGNVAFAAEDTYTLGVTTSATKASFVKVFDRLYSARTRQLNLPVAASPTIADSLIA